MIGRQDQPPPGSPDGTAGPVSPVFVTAPARSTVNVQRCLSMQPAGQSPQPISTVTAHPSAGLLDGVEAALPDQVGVEGLEVREQRVRGEDGGGRPVGVRGRGARRGARGPGSARRSVPRRPRPTRRATARGSAPGRRGGTGAGGRDEQRAGTNRTSGGRRRVIGFIAPATIPTGRRFPVTHAVIAPARPSAPGRPGCRRPAARPSRSGSARRCR